MKLKTSKKRVARYLKGNPDMGEVSLTAIALRRTLNAHPGKTLPDIECAISKFEKYLGYHVH